MPATQRLPDPYRPEPAVVSQRLAALRSALNWAEVAQTAAPWVQAVRDHPPPFWAMESLQKEYPISSAEGLALMRLAEALLRIPDAETAVALTADQLGRADFERSSDQVLARLSGAAIALSKHFLPATQASSAHQSEPGLMSKLGAKTVVAATLRAVQLLGRQFVLGQTIADAMHQAQTACSKHAGRAAVLDRAASHGSAATTSGDAGSLTYSYDMLGEGARTDSDALRYLASYTDAIHAVASRARRVAAPQHNDGISIKLSALHPRYEDAQSQRVLAELVPRVWTLCELAALANINLTIDAEEVERLELSLEVLDALLGRVAQHHPQWTGLGLALQAYQTRALELVEVVTAMARKHQVRLMCRLVKGAYWDAEIKRAQELGLPGYPVFTHKHHTDVSYLACAQSLLAAPDAIYPQFATHNAATVAAILQMAARTGGAFELQRLHGMGEGVYREVLKNPLVACRVYAPVGAHRDLLAYLVRRLLENGANSSFVHQLVDASVDMQSLLISPLRLEPHSALPLPADLFGTHAGARRNSAGLDLTVPTQRDPLLAAMRSERVPVVPECAPERIPERTAAAFALAASSFAAWSSTPVSARAAVLRRAADTMEARTPLWCALLVQEAFKTWGDAVSEVREAVDFLRYYASEAERIQQPQAMPAVTGGLLAPATYGVTGESNILTLTGRGVWVCISPWNFPLAIFVGQVAAALATGNTVLAKPAEQTPGVAQAAVDLMHAAGVPQGALQLVHGPGETVGAALVAHPKVAGVVFTGSTQVAKVIQRALAAKDGPIVPLIAETGGINAMVVDSSALPEQVVDAVVLSAFRSAGQRCSALRLLCVHSAIADHVIEMLRGAARELRVGDPVDLATDVGPVIDADAFTSIGLHLARLHASAKPLLSEPPMDRSSARTAHLIAPSAFEVASIAEVNAEVFGPVLQIVRWDGDPLAVIAQINALGYGLTLGIQTRIDSRAQALAAAAHVGNIYINRNMIGAVVGVQPFGGEGLSGTGPKAGGPHYLYRFCAEKTVTINTTAAGGNAALLTA
ncbi:bifunctional proline dehydrogenase/L-glutamate gamma-semialdehyde dehydrogenase PutA [Rhodoferax sp.]|jgi:RHH-type proline utilization regulon transcriptional repressor/proline dehydrogenase/delta 1-pyrroline-5-carboxylate dehydrogenase|uniref:bifunctional proline dehydrogenase/L-glutamate gamma-semialdehyde dehydrogenase PutA n=1 Tax=Rhodoferax sp. TaxID=50421 RepID=UPI0037835974